LSKCFTKKMPNYEVHRIASPRGLANGDLSGCADARACRACRLALSTDCVRRGETIHARWLTEASHRLGGAWQSAHRRGSVGRRGLRPLARPITGLEPPHVPASSLACAPAAQPPPR